jgi:hypothetical protein
MKQGEENVLVLTLSSELATKIQNALSMGRQHRLSAQYTKAKVKELEVERLDNKGLVETLDFELQLKKKELEQALVPSDKQRKELSLLASNLYRTRGNMDVIERNLVKLEEGDKKEMERWRDAWFEVDRVLDIVWMDTGILKRYETANKERPERTLPPPGIGDNEVDHAMDNFETRRRLSDHSSQLANYARKSPPTDQRGRRDYRVEGRYQRERSDQRRTSSPRRKNRSRGRSRSPSVSRQRERMEREHRESDEHHERMRQYARESPNRDQHRRDGSERRRRS